MKNQKIDNERTIKNWPKTCPSFKLSMIMVKEKLNQFFESVTFAYLKHLFVDSYDWAIGVHQF